MESARQLESSSQEISLPAALRSLEEVCQGPLHPCIINCCSVKKDLWKETAERQLWLLVTSFQAPICCLVAVPGLFLRLGFTQSFIFEVGSQRSVELDQRLPLAAT